MPLEHSGNETNFPRRSPVRLPGEAAETEERNGWTVIRRYSGEGGGPWIVDLSHCDKWDVRDAALDRVPAIDDVPMPARAGDCVYGDGRLLLRPAGNWVLLWRLLAPEAILPHGPAFTDVTDGYALLALAGSEVPDILEKATPMDALPPDAAMPRFLRGPVFRRPALLATLIHRPDMTVTLVACGRGYGRYMAEAFMEAGEEFGMLPAGEDRFAGLALPARDANPSDGFV
jgi:hypothetical protein